MRARLRELGHAVGELPTGPLNALVDVSGVRVGHRTLVEGDDVRTGVTAVLPHGDNLYTEKVLGGCHVVNGYGKAAGLSQLEELGTIESPLLLTSTVSVGPVWEAGLRHALEQNPAAARDRDTVNVIVGECFDGWLSDARGLHVRSEHALEAIAAARADDVAEGSVGAGTGAGCFGYKAGVGTSSRRVEGGYVLGCLVVANYGARHELALLTGKPAPADGERPRGPGADQPAPGADERGPEADEPPEGGSIMVVLATDAPLSERQLRRLAARSALGLGRAGSVAANASGEYALAFSTAHRVPHRAEGDHAEFRFLRDDARATRQLFRAVVEAVQEAVLSSLCAADEMAGRDGHVLPAFPHELL